MTIKKTLSVLLAIVMIGTMFTSLPFTVNAVGVDTATIAAGTVKDVGRAEELSAVCTEINTNGGEYTIKLTADITGGNIDINNANAVVTMIGNGFGISNPAGQIVSVWNGAVILGDGQSTLTLTGGVYNDNPGIVYIIGQNSSCTMNDLVTIQDNQSNNYIGGGVTVAYGTFIMEGGTIRNCRIKNGYYCYGGGVGVIDGGSFIMNGGTITECYVENESDDGTYQYPCTAGGGVFVYRSSFTMNGGSINHCWADSDIASGGGVAVINSYQSILEHPDNMGNYDMGYIDSNFTMNGGEISDCNANLGGGALVFGLGYVNIQSMLTPLGHSYDTLPGPDNPGLYLNGGKMTESGAGYGGAIFINTIRDSIPVNIKNMEIKSNEASYGGGISVLSYWVKPHIENCLIADNHTYEYGGGIYLKNVSNGAFLKDTAITGNTSEARGAGVYYDNTSLLYISGANTIQRNTYNGTLNNLNIYQKNGTIYPVYVNGALTGSQIGLSDPTLWDDGMTDEDAFAVSTEYLTSGYKEYNPEVHPDKYFTSDHETWFVDRSVKTTTTQPDTSSKVRRVYSAKKYTAVLPNTAAYAGHQNQYVITDIQNPDLQGKKITSITDIVSELIYRFNNNSNYKSDRTLGDSTYTYYQYSAKDANLAIPSITLNRGRNNSSITIQYNMKQPRGGSITYTASESNQNYYANSGELVLQITSREGNFSNYTFSDDYAETTVEYVNANPQGNVIYEYDEYSDVIAKYVIDDPTDYSEIQAQITVETGTDSEVRLVRKNPDYHINNTDIAHAKYNDKDIFTSYVEESAGIKVKYGDTIERFYTIPEATPTTQDSCPYIFKGWYYDQDNENDTRPVKFGEDKYFTDIYAHWIKVENITKDERDKTILPVNDHNQYGGFDLAGVQIRMSTNDYNFGEVTPGGMRFVTSLSMDVVREINKIQPNNIEYGYVAATNENWINFHSKAPEGKEKLQYVSTSANGIDTSSDRATDENYYGFAHNVECTSQICNTESYEVPLDHQNYTEYLLYSLVITYEGNDATGKDTNVLARPYIRYTDANNSERVAYSEYRGDSNTIGGCYISYNGAKELLPLQ